MTAANQAQAASAAGSVGRVELLGEPGLDQRLIRNIALVRGDLDPLEQTQRQAQRDRRRRGSQVWQPYALGPAPVHPVSGVVVLPEAPLLRLALEVGIGLALLGIACPLLAAHVAGGDHTDPGASARSVKVTCSRRPSSVRPSAWKRGSRRLWRGSSTISSGWLRNTCSASSWLTPCLSSRLRAFPSSHSNPWTPVQSICDVYNHHMRVGARLAARKADARG